MFIALSARAVAKDVVTIGLARWEQDQGSGDERHYVLTMVLGPITRQDPLLGCGMKLRPSHPADFVTPLSGNN